ncbi:hypothetical protein DY102_07065 [Apilactobacillus timberlakei]|uniref:hypothetical protein n=1 Tax=Apilactobacillus timberlakei TaxID=2008380 RepID=UPI00112E13F8|nr:hypothetical protein [Apilactobacillus timberlakei]TPR21444.1 hypothetical protein DY102_07065 [Apilactobacillus timberlakei]
MTNRKNIVALMWKDIVTIHSSEKTKDKRGFIINKDKIILDNEPCKVVKKSLASGNQTFYDEVKYNALLLIRNNIDVPKGADIVITDLNGNKSKYQRASGGYTNYSTHQEIAMIYDEKA